MKTIIKIIIILFFNINILSASAVSLDVQAVILYKILSFNNTIKHQSDSVIKIGILAQENLEEHNKILAAFKVLENWVIHDKKVIVSTVYNVYDAIGNHVLYIYSVENDRIEDYVLDVLYRNKIMSISGNEEYVKQGLTVGVRLEKNLPKIIINKKSAKKTNTLFSKKLLDFAEIIN